MSNEQNANKTIQYIKLLEEYDQTESLYDTTVYTDPALQSLNRSALPPLEFSFSSGKQNTQPTTSHPSPTGNPNTSTGWYSLWDALETSITVVWVHCAQCNGNCNPSDHCNSNMRLTNEPNLHKRNPLLRGPTHEEVSATIDAIKSQSQRNESQSLAAIARQRRNPSPPKGKRNPSPPKSRPDSEPPREKPPARNIALLASVYQVPTVEARQPTTDTGTVTQTEDASSYQRTEPDNNSVRQLEPEETSVILQDKKDRAAKKRAARAKKKGAVAKTPTPTPALVPAPEEASKATTASLASNHTNTSYSHTSQPERPKHKQQPPQQQQHHHHHHEHHQHLHHTSAAKTNRKYAEPRSSSPGKRRSVNKEPPGIRKHLNDDASVAPPRSAPRATRQVVAEKQPKCIVRHDLEDLDTKPKSQTGPWSALLSTGAIPACAGAERSATPPPIRPCDLPRGPDIKKKNLSSPSNFFHVAGEFLQTFGL